MFKKKKNPSTSLHLGKSLGSVGGSFELITSSPELNLNPHWRSNAPACLNAKMKKTVESILWGKRMGLGSRKSIYFYYFFASQMQKQSVVFFCHQRARQTKKKWRNLEKFSCFSGVENTKGKKKSRIVPRSCED
uniref:Uncharacterized protein n=1 Tax=Micrurus corallinus TaxID=54390 RepID=A0A2D4FAU8_MICCO